MTKISRAAFKSIKASRFTSNGIGNITATVVRAHEEDTADSVVFLDDDISTNANFAVDGTKLTDRATIKTFVEANSSQVNENNVEVFDDFIVSADWTSVNTSFGSGTSSTWGQNVYGVALMSYTAASPATRNLYKLYGRIGAGFTTIIRWRARATESNGTNSHYIMSGKRLNPATAGDATNGIYFRHTDDENGGRWQAVCMASSVSTMVDTTIAVDTEFHIFEIRVNSDRTEVTFYIDGTLRATITTNIPTSTLSLGSFHRLDRRAGDLGSGSGYVIDWHHDIYTRTTAR